MTKNYKKYYLIWGLFFLVYIAFIAFANFGPFLTISLIDFVISINGKHVSIFGSQGQQRTTVLTLKLCELKIMKEALMI